MGMDILQGAHYLFTSRGQQGGPVDGNQLVALAQQGHITAADHLWSQGWKQWHPTTSFNQLLMVLQQTQTVVPTPQVNGLQGRRGGDPGGGTAVQTPTVASATAAPAAATAGASRASAGVLAPNVVARPQPANRAGGPPTTSRLGARTTSSLGRRGGRAGTVKMQIESGAKRRSRPGASYGMLITLLLGAIGACGLAFLLFSLSQPGYAGRPPRADVPGGLIPGLFVAGGVCTLAYLILSLVYLGRAWAYLQELPVARTTPERAVGFLLIPLFNLYWMFEAFPGWVTDYHNFVDMAQQPGAPRPSRELAISACVLTFLMGPLLHPFVMQQMCSGVNYLARLPKLELDDEEF